MIEYRWSIRQDMMEANRLDILNKVKAGEMTVEEGARLLTSLEQENEPGFDRAADAPVMQAMSAEDLHDAGIRRYQNWWLYPLWLGLGVLVFSAGLMSWGASTGRFFWFYCAWLPLLLGVAVIVLSAWSRDARWLHVRVREENPQKSTNIKISFPLPTRLAGWALRTFGSRIPPLREKGIAEQVLPLLETIGSTREPLVVEVDDKDGEKVEVYII